MFCYLFFVLLCIETIVQVKKKNFKQVKIVILCYEFYLFVVKQLYSQCDQSPYCA